MVKSTFKCEICGTTFETYEEAAACEALGVPPQQVELGTTTKMMEVLETFVQHSFYTNEHIRIYLCRMKYPSKGEKPIPESELLKEIKDDKERYDESFIVPYGDDYRIICTLHVYFPTDLNPIRWVTLDYQKLSDDKITWEELTLLNRVLIELPISKTLLHRSIRRTPLWIPNENSTKELELLESKLNQQLHKAEKQYNVKLIRD